VSCKMIQFYFVSSVRDKFGCKKISGKEALVF